MFPRECPEVAPGDTAFFQLSSGSTGTPKCIAIAHSAVIAHARYAWAALGLGTGSGSFNWLPLDHVAPTPAEGRNYMICTDLHCAVDSS